MDEDAATFESTFHRILEDHHDDRTTHCRPAGIDSLSESQVSRMAADLNAIVEDLRHRALAAAGPFTFVAADALTMKVRKGGRVINAVVLPATGVNGDGHREVLGMRVATSALLSTRIRWTCIIGGSSD